MLVSTVKLIIKSSLKYVVFNAFRCIFVLNGLVFEVSKLRIFLSFIYAKNTSTTRKVMFCMQIKSFLTILLCFFGLISIAQTKNNTKSFIVVLDAGHGGKDPGRPTSYGYKEKDIALDVVLLVLNILH